MEHRIHVATYLTNPCIVSRAIRVFKRSAPRTLQKYVWLNTSASRPGFKIAYQTHCSYCTVLYTQWKGRVTYDTYSQALFLTRRSRCTEPRLLLRTRLALWPPPLFIGCLRPWLFLTVLESTVACHCHWYPLHVYASRYELASHELSYLAIRSTWCNLKSQYPVLTLAVITQVVLLVVYRVCTPGFSVCKPLGLRPRGLDTLKPAQTINRYSSDTVCMF